MAKIIFKKFNIQGLGGLMPPYTHILSEKGEYYLGEIEDNKLWEIKCFQPISISEEIAKGFLLIGVDSISEEVADMEITTRELTEEEIANKAKAELFLIKLETRAKITANIGDNNDLIADINKRISILERITYQTLDYLYSQSELIDDIPAELQNAYGSLLNNYVNMISTGDLKDAIDLEDINNVFDKILDRINKTSIICKEYISQKEV